MAIQLADNFSYQGAKPLDARIQYATVAAMKAVADSALYEGCKAYCVETEKEYQWKSGNTVDPTTGKWREYEGGGGDFEKMSQNDVDDIKGAVSITPRVEPFEKMTASDVEDIKDAFQIYRPFAGLTMGIGGGYAPLGTINFFDATVAPQDWLACDGSVYNIADYPQLAEWYATQHGASNFYGGNGTTTFAVPDLQGEFLRGTGTNSHTNQGSGGNVGEHQDGTLLPTVNTDGKRVYSSMPGINSNTNNADSEIGNNSYGASPAGGTSGVSLGYNLYTSRPTNTSFLICVKAVVAGEVYSTEERVVGTWIDGKKIYQRTWDNLSISLRAGNWYSTNIDSTNCIPVNAVAYAGGNDNFIKYLNVRSHSNQWKLLSDVDVGTFTVLTIQYTKTTD